jgi:hypothetical protein
MDDVKEQRTGQNKGAAGLDASAMQSSTKAAVAAAVTASQAQVEMLARIFAEQTLKPMFRGVLREIIMNQSAVRNIKVRNRWVAVDPREWNANMDLTVNVMLGTGLIEEKVGALIQVSEKQHEILTELGPQNPVVSLGQYRNTLAKITELLGFKDSVNFFKPVDDAQLEAEAQAAAQQPPPPSPEEIIAQAQVEIERMKAEKDAAIAQAKEAREREDMYLRDDRERDKLAVEVALRVKEMELKYKQEVDKAQIQAEAKRVRETTASAEG